MDLTDIKKEVDAISTGVKELVNTAQTEAKAAFDKSATKEEIEVIKSDWQKRFDANATKTDKHLEELQKQSDALETKVKTQVTAADNKNKSFSENLQDALTAKKDELLGRKDQNGGGFIKFDVKAAATMTTANYSGGVVGLTTWDSSMTRPALRRPFLRELVTNRPISTAYVAWAEMTARDGAVSTVAEGALKPAIDFDIVEASKKVEKIAGWIKASKESLADIPNLTAEINQELILQVNLKLDQQIYAGTGTTPQLKGITVYAPVISVAGLPFATAVATPNRADVLFVAEAVVANSLFTATHALVNPLDWAMIMLDKDTQGNSINRTYVGPDGQMRVGNLTVVPNTGVTLGTFVVGDMSKDILGIREEVNIQIGYENDDFTKNLVTILAEMRAVNYIKLNNVNAFVQGVFATVQTAITKP